MPEAVPIPGSPRHSSDGGQTLARRKPDSTPADPSRTGLAEAPRAGGDAPRHERLSSRERHVFGALASGKTVKDIAAGLSLSVQAVSTYRTRLLAKLGLRTNAEIAEYAIRAGLIE